MVANNDEKRTFSVTYVPKVAGLHKVGDTNMAPLCHWGVPTCGTAVSPRLCGTAVAPPVALWCPHVCHCVTVLSPRVSLRCPHVCPPIVVLWCPHVWHCGVPTCGTVVSPRHCGTAVSPRVSLCH